MTTGKETIWFSISLLLNIRNGTYATFNINSNCVPESSSYPIVNSHSLFPKVHIFAWLLAVNTMVKTSEGHGLGMFIWAGEPGDGTEIWVLICERNHRCIAAARHHTQTLDASHQKEKTSHLHNSAKHVKTVWNCLGSKFWLIFGFFWWSKDSKIALIDLLSH